MKKLRVTVITKVIIPLLCIGMLISVTSIVMSYRQASIVSNAVAMQQLEDITHTIELTIEKELQAYVHSLNTLTHIVDKKETITTHDKEVIVNGIEILLKEYPELFGGWAIIEAEGVSNSEYYKNTYLHDDEGRFAPYIEDAKGELTYQTLKSHKKEGEEAYFYKIPLQTGEIYVTPATPYEYKGEDVVVISICMPFEVGGKIAGIMGVDLEIKDLKEYVASYKIYDTGYAVLYDNKRIVLSHPSDKFIGTSPYEDNKMIPMEKKAMDQTMATGEFTIVEARVGGEGAMAYKTFIPVVIHNKVEPYIIQIVVPKTEIYAGTAKLRLTMMIMGMGVIVLFTFMIQRLVIEHIKKVDDDMAWLRYLKKWN